MSSRNALRGDIKNGCVADYILAGKRDNRHDCTTGQFKKEPARELRSGENKLSDVRSFIILRSQEGLISFNKNNRANFSGEKKKQQTNKQTKTDKKETIYAVKLSGVSRFWEYA